MTRGNARELALHLIFSRSFTGEAPEPLLDRQLAEPYYDSLAGECPLYAERPYGRQRQYLSAVVQGVAECEDALNQQIRRYAIGWDISRISRIARSVLQLAMYEIQSVEDVPTNAAVAEAVRLAQKYDGEDTGAFVNGILGAFVRSLNQTVAPTGEETL